MHKAMRLWLFAQGKSWSRFTLEDGLNALMLLNWLVLKTLLLLFQHVLGN